MTQDERQRSIKPVTPPDNVAFQSSVDLMIQKDDNAAYVAAYTARQSQRPICTHCGKSEHTIQKCFKLHGFPPGYKTHGSTYIQKNHSQPKTQMMSAPAQMPLTPANAIANAYATAGSLHYNNVSASNLIPHITSGGTNVMLQDFTPQQIRSLIAQFNAHVRVPANPIPSSLTNSKASITDQGIMASTSTSGTILYF